MAEEGKTAIAGYFPGALLIAIVWFFLSFVVTLALANAEDNLDMAATVPWPLKIASAILLFPMRYLQQWDRMFFNSTEHSALPVYLGMLINSLFWGFVLVFLYRLACRSFMLK